MPRKKVSVGKVWGITTVIFCILSYLYIISVMQLKVWVLAVIYLAYFLFSILSFRKTLFGELGFYYHAVGRDDIGLKMCKKACEQGTKSTKALNLYGLVMLRAGKADEALDYFNKAMKYNSNRLQDKMIKANIASCYWIKGEIDTAIEKLETMQRQYGYVNADVQTTLGYFYLLKDDYEKAIYYTNKALEDDAEHGAALDNLGQIYFRKGELKEAEEYFKKALEYKPTMADSKFYLGLINEKNGNYEDAADYYTQAHESNVTALNTVTRAEIDSKHSEFAKYKKAD